MEWEQAQSYSRKILIASVTKKKKKRPQVHLEKNKVSSCSRSCPKHLPVTGDSVFLQSSGEMRLCCFCAVYIPLMCLTLSLSLTVHPATLPRCLPLMFSFKCWSSWFRIREILWQLFIFCRLCAWKREGGQLSLIPFFSKSENIVEIIYLSDIWVKRSWYTWMTFDFCSYVHELINQKPRWEVVIIVKLLH